MRSIITSARSRILRWTWCITVAVLLWLPAATHATPDGFVEEHVAGNTWVYPETARDQVRELQRTVGDAWTRIATELGVVLSSDLTIRIGRGPDEMQALAPRGVRLPAYASGVAFPDQGLIYLTLTAPQTWELVDVPSVLVHEMSHVALHRAVAGAHVPRWFSEGVAIDQAQERSLERIRALWEGVIGDRLMPLSGLSNAFPTHHHGVNLAYAQSADFVRHLKRQPHGTLRLNRALASMRGGTPFADAIEQHFRAPLVTLEREWHEELSLRYSHWPLLLSGLGFMWFFLALLLVVGYVRARRRHTTTLARWDAEERAMDLAAKERAGANKEERLDAPAVEDLTKPLNEPQQASGVPTIQHEGQHHTLH